MGIKFYNPHYFIIMELLLLKCKNCGADLSGGADGVLKCRYCGSEHLISSVGDTKCSIKFGELVSVESAGGDVIIPNGVMSIGKRAFADCNMLKKVVIPDTVIEICDEAFINTPRLVDIKLPESLVRIGDRSFKGCGIEKVFLSNKLKKVGEEAFMNCENLTSVVLEKGFNYNLVKCFKGCVNLDGVVCDLDDFFLSFRRGIESNRKGSTKPTLFDVFQGTPYFHALYDKCIKQCICLRCGSKMKHKFISFNRDITCKECKSKFEF